MPQLGLHRVVRELIRRRPAGERGETTDRRSSVTTWSAHPHRAASACIAAMTSGGTGRSRCGVRAVWRIASDCASVEVGISDRIGG